MMLLIKNCKVANEDGDRVVDVLVEEGVIKEIKESILGNGCEIIDAKKSYLLPGIVDLNISLKDRVFSPEFVKRLKRKALSAGVTTSVLMPNFKPKIESEKFIRLLKEYEGDIEGEMVLSIDAVNRQDGRLNEIARVLDEGVGVVRVDSDVDGNLLRRVFEYSLMKKSPLFVSLINRSMDNNGVMNEGEISFRLGLEGLDKISEISEASKITSVSEYYNTTTLLQSLTTYEAIDSINRLKKENSKTFTEVSILHLILSDKACMEFDTMAKVYPPFRDEEEVEALRELLKRGMIDTLTSLHSAVSFINKDLPFNSALEGVDILKEYLPLSYTALVKSGFIDIHTLTKLLSYNPARVLKRDEIGLIKEGKRADLIIFNPDIETKHNNKLLKDFKLYGSIERVISRGVVVY
jgi:dihydroorotase